MKASKRIEKANKDFYRSDYTKIVMKGGFLNRWVYEKTHKDLERFASKNSDQNLTIIELGAQADQHRRFVKQNYRYYISSDIQLHPLINAVKEESLKLDELNDPKLGPYVSFEKIDALDIPYEDSEFNRLLTTCLIAHVTNPVDALEEWRRVVVHGGEIDFFVPCEPGFMIRLARNITHKRKTSNWKLSYDLLHYSQHKNHFPAINEFVKYVFKEDAVTRRLFPFNLLPWEFNLWAVYHVKISKQASK